MAREKKKQGFSMDNIVDTIIGNDNDGVIINDNDVIDDDGCENNLLDRLIQNNKPQKMKVQLYLDKDVNNHLNHFGKQVGKANGGKSQFANEIMKKILIENNLWNDKIANK